MKTYNNLYENICSFENLYRAYLSCRKSKRYYHYVLDFGWNVEEELQKLRSELLSGTYQHGEYHTFILHDAKKREIQAAPFRDRIVHRAIYNILEPIFDKTFIFDSYACRNGKGTHKAIKRLQKFLQIEFTKQKPLYCLQCDISKYFRSVSHEKLFCLVKKNISDEKTLTLVKKILKSTDQGIPIGNLTSQIFANLYLNEIDRYIKKELRQKYFLRYMDDFLILSFDKKELHDIKEKIRIFLKQRLFLKFHPQKAMVYSVSRGVDFLGFVIFKNHKLLRKNTVKRFLVRTKKNENRLKRGKLSLEKYNQSLESWLAYAIFGNSWNLRKSFIKKINFLYRVFTTYFFTSYSLSYTRFS